MSSVIEQNKSIVLKVFEEFDRQNYDAMKELLSEDLVAYLPGMPGPQGVDTFLQFGRAFYAAFPDGHHKFDEVIGEKDKVVTIGTFNGTHKGELQGIPPTGKQLKLPAMHVDRIEGGKIVEHRGYASMNDLMQQLGVMPQQGQQK